MSWNRDGPVRPGPEEAVLVDARGHLCPVPTLRLRRALERAAEGSVVVLLADDPLARIDLPHFATETGHMILSSRIEGRVLRFSVRKAGGAAGVVRGGSMDAG